MRPVLLVISAIVLLAALGAPAVRAEPSFGVGLARSLDGSSGVAARYAGPVHVLVEVARRGPASLAVGARAGGYVVDEVESSLTFIAELPLRLELDAFRWLSVDAEGGVAYASNGEELAELDQLDLTAPGVVGAVGFTAWL